MNRRASVGRGLAFVACVLAIVGASSQLMKFLGHFSAMLRQPELAGYLPVWLSPLASVLVAVMAGGVVALSLYVFVRTLQMQRVHPFWLVIVYLAAILALATFCSLFLPPWTVNLVNVIR